MTLRDRFPALPQPETINFEDISDLGNVSFRGDVRSFAWDGGGSLDGGADPVASAGFLLDSSAGSAQFAGSLFLGGSLAVTGSVTVSGTLTLSGALVASGDIYSSNWDGATPADLSVSEDATASAGFYFDGSAGAIQAEGDIYLGGSLNLIGSGIFDFGSGFDMRVFTDNPSPGVDTLWIRGDNDGTDHVVIGPTSGSAWFDTIRLRADTISIETTDLFHPFPSGIIYDHGFDVTTDAGSLGAWPENITSLAATAAVPDGLPVTIFVWAWVRVNLTMDQEFAALDVTIGGSLPAFPALVEQDLTTSADGTGNTGSGGTGSTGTSGTLNIATGGSGGSPTMQDSSSGLHTWNLVEGNTAPGPSHTHPGPSHTHALSGSWHTLSYVAARSYTPSGTTAAIQARGGTEGSSQAFDDGFLQYLVVIN